jgi:hypothetical protein
MGLPWRRGKIWFLLIGRKLRNLSPSTGAGQRLGPHKFRTRRASLGSRGKGPIAGGSDAWRQSSFARYRPLSSYALLFESCRSEVRRLD